jgi:hypothetical protein
LGQKIPLESLEHLFAPVFFSKGFPITASSCCIRASPLSAQFTHATSVASYREPSPPVAVLPTGQNFGRKTQKWPHKNLSGRKKWRPNFLQIFQKMAEKWPNFFAVCSSPRRLDYSQK